MEQRIPLCIKCPSAPGSDGEGLPSPTAQPIMKPDIVFFGEGMPDEFHRAMAFDKEECDLIIVIGSSLKVRPVALIPCTYIHQLHSLIVAYSHFGFQVLYPTTSHRF